MTNAKLTKKQLADKLVAEVNAMMVENRQLRQLNAEWAADARRLKFTIVRLNAQLVALRAGACSEAA